MRSESASGNGSSATTFPRIPRHLFQRNRTSRRRLRHRRERNLPIAHGQRIVRHVRAREPRVRSGPGRIAAARERAGHRKVLARSGVPGRPRQGRATESESVSGPRIGRQAEAQRSAHGAQSRQAAARSAHGARSHQAAARNGHGVRTGRQVPAVTNVLGVQSAHQVRAKGSAPGRQSVPQVEGGSNPNRPWRPKRPPEEGGGRGPAGSGGDREWKPNRPPGQGSAGGNRGWKPGRPSGKPGGGSRSWTPGKRRAANPERGSGRPDGRRGGRPPSGGRKGGGGGSSR